MPDNLYTTYKLDRKGLAGKQVLRFSTPGRTTKGLIPSTRVRRQPSQGAAPILLHSTLRRPRRPHTTDLFNH
ncbi:hypothetical protein F2Q69_00054558 [Brassica cretica]|uniref:Uncharacterized protein n=1 Tax=Brassica cretica TaxID=69181 RepID=A0A8S9MUC0_BRACR|nr:hypothetical protein F2Q69_00054558 [Brassica cretica]